LREKVHVCKAATPQAKENSKVVEPYKKIDKFLIINLTWVLFALAAAGHYQQEIH